MSSLCLVEMCEHPLGYKVIEKRFNEQVSHYSFNILTGKKVTLFQKRVRVINVKRFCWGPQF
jgi:hypothetical protein